MRYTAYTLDGSPIFGAEDAQKLADKVFTYLQENRKPHIGYTYDEWYPGRFMTWQLRDHLEGYPHDSFAKVADWWKGRHTSNERDWRDGAPPCIGWWNASSTRQPDVWRWWNGSRWSMPAYPEFSAVRAAQRAAKPAPAARIIKWNDDWPENAACKPARKA